MAIRSCFIISIALIRARGLNSHVGFLHPLRSGHPALVSDLMEEFRALVIDALMLSPVLNDRLAPSDFLLPQTPDKSMPALRCGEETGYPCL